MGVAAFAGVGAAEEDTAPLADGSKVSDAVTDLLGLPFEDFCTCVVLPQGDFAEFLHAPAGKRQEKLERILGLGVYDLIMRKANTEAGAADLRAETDVPVHVIPHGAFDYLAHQEREEPLPAELAAVQGPVMPPASPTLPRSATMSGSLQSPSLCTSHAWSGVFHRSSVSV